MNNINNFGMGNYGNYGYQNNKNSVNQSKNQQANQSSLLPKDVIDGFNNRSGSTTKEEEYKVETKTSFWGKIKQTYREIKEFAERVLHHSASDDDS